MTIPILKKLFFDPSRILIRISVSNDPNEMLEKSLTILMLNLAKKIVTFSWKCIIYLIEIKAKVLLGL